MESYRYVIVGGGMVAGYAARQFVEQGLNSGELLILSSDNVLPYERPPLSKTFLLGRESEESIRINVPEFYSTHGITVRLRCVVEKVDTEKRRLRARGCDEVAYEKLLVATGARPRRFEVPGAQLEGISYLRSLSDAQRLRGSIEGAECAVVVGGGFIGMEVAAVLAQKGIETTLIFPGDRLNSRVFAPEMSDSFRKYYEARGVTVLPGARVSSLAGSGRVSEVVLESGGRLPADFVVAGIGVTPAAELLEGTGVRLDNGIVVNERLETTAAGIFAAGDVANYRDVLTGTSRRVEHWDTAVKQGQHAAKVLAGSREPYENVPYFFSDFFDLSYEFWGDSTGAERVVYRGDVNSTSFSAWWLKEGCVVAAFAMNRPEEEREAAPEWIRSRRRVALETLEDTSRPLR